MEDNVSKSSLTSDSSSSTLVIHYSLAKFAYSKFFVCSLINNSSAGVSIIKEESTGDSTPDTKRHALLRISYQLKVQIKSSKNLKRMHQAMQHIFSDFRSLIVSPSPSPLSCLTSKSFRFLLSCLGLWISSYLLCYFYSRRSSNFYILAYMKILIIKHDHERKILLVR